MSASDDIWILGINMTKFGKHTDRDVVDLASEAMMAALADGGVTMADMGVLAAGNLMGSGGIGQQLQKQVGQTGIPVYNVSNACATGATALRTAIMAIKAGECDMGLAVGVEKLAGVGLLGGGGAPRRTATSGSRRAATERSRHRRPHRHRHDARCVRPGRHGVRPQVRRRRLRAVRQDLGEEPRALDAQPAGGVLEAVHARGDHGRHDDRLPEHPPDVLGQLRRCGRRGGRERREAADAVARAAAARGEGVGVGAHVRPVAGGLPGPPRRQHAHPQRGETAYEQAGVGPEDLDLVELHDCFATAELVHYDNLRLCDEGGAVDFFKSGAPWRDGGTAGQRVGRPAVEGPPDLGDRHRQHLGGLPPPSR